MVVSEGGCTKHGYRLVFKNADNLFNSFCGGICADPGKVYLILPIGYWTKAKYEASSSPL
jgi:hypothetical protein